jgi:hypothetical protein
MFGSGDYNLRQCFVNPLYKSLIGEETESGELLNPTGEFLDFDREEKEKVQRPYRQVETKRKAWNNVDERIDELTSKLKDDPETKEFRDFFQDIKETRSRRIIPAESKRFTRFTESYARICALHLKLFFEFNRVCKSMLSSSSYNWKKIADNYNSHVKDLERELENAKRSDWFGDTRQVEKDIDLLNINTNIRIKIVKLQRARYADLKEKELASIFADLKKNHEILENIYSSEFKSEEFVTYIDPIPTTNWEDPGQFIVFCDADDDYGQSTLLNRFEKSHDGDLVTTAQNAILAEDKEELRKIFDVLMEVTTEIDNETELILAIASCKDVKDSVSLEKELNRPDIDSGDLNKLGYKLLQDAANHHEVVTQHLREKAGGKDPAYRYHTICVTADVSNSWNGVLPRGLHGEIKVRPSEWAMDEKQTEKVYELVEGHSYVTKTSCSFSLNSYHDMGLEEFTDTNASQNE